MAFSPLERVARLGGLLVSTCGQCRAELEAGAAVCDECGMPVPPPEEEPTLDVMAGSRSVRLALGTGVKNLKRLLSSLEAVERGSGTLAEARSVSGEILAATEKWLTIMRTHPPRVMIDEVLVMHQDYIPLGERLLAEFRAYDAALARGALEEARKLMDPIADDLVSLRELQIHYDQVIAEHKKKLDEMRQASSG